MSVECSNPVSPLIKKSTNRNRVERELSVISVRVRVAFDLSWTNQIEIKSNYNNAEDVAIRLEKMKIAEKKRLAELKSAVPG